MPFPMTPQKQAAPLQSFAKKFDGGMWSDPQGHGTLSFMNPMVPRGTMSGGMSNQSNYDPMQLFQWLQKMMQGMNQG